MCGSGKTDANSYADVADADAYFEGHLYPAAWTGATAERKAAALVMATRLIDSQYQFNGGRTGASQALQWPRAECPDPDGGVRSVSVLLPMGSGYVDYNVVPGAVVRATCEMARELLISDRTAAPAGEGIEVEQSSHAIHNPADSGSESDSAMTKYSKGDRRPVISRVAQAMLGRFGALVSGGSGVVRLVRA